MPDKVFGEIPGYQEGDLFTSRQDLAAAGIHRPLQAGISGGAKEGADSIVLSSGYEDDQDYGDLMIYTGHGGRDPVTSQQVTDQLLTFGNMALAYSCMHGLPIRVVRGANHRSPYSPPMGYCYGKLYRIEDYWRERGISGHTIWRFRLVKIASQDQTIIVPKLISETPGEYITAPRQALSVMRIVRDTVQTRKIKVLYDYSCQVCQVRLVGSAGPYAEVAHIRPLGTPHNGPILPTIYCVFAPITMCCLTMVGLPSMTTGNCWASTDV
jgi:putative restriction endonuclease